MTLRGTVTDLVTEQVLINDRPVPVHGGVFATTLSFPADSPVLPIYVLAIADNGSYGGDHAAVVRGTMAAPEANIENALQVGLGNDLFTVIGDAVAGAFVDLDLGPFFAGLNPIVDLFGVTVDVTAATIGGASFDGAFVTDGVLLYGELTDVVLTVDVTALGSTSTTTITLSSLSVDIHADALVYSGYVTVSINSIDVAHDGLTYDGPLSPLIGRFGVDLLLDTVEGVIEFAVQLLVPNALEDVLTSLVYDAVLLGFDIHAGLASLDIGPGAAMAGLSLNVFLTDPADHPWPHGSLFTAGDPPDMLNGRPDPALDFGFALAFSDNFLNRFLFSACEADLLTFDVGDPAVVNDPIPLTLNAGILGGLLPAFADLDPSIPASLHLSPMAPPVAVPQADGSFTLLVPDYRLDFYLYPPDAEPWLALSLTMRAAGALDLNLDDGGALRVSVPAGEIEFLLLDDPIGETAAIPTTLADWISQLLAPLLDEVLQLVPIRLPAIGDVQIDPLWLGTAGEAGNFWTGYFGMTYGE